MAILSVRTDAVLQRLATWIPKREVMVALKEGDVGGVVDVVVAVGGVVVEEDGVVVAVWSLDALPS